MDYTCIFCRIANGTVPTKFIAETTEVFVIADIAPRAKTHLLVVPKKHIRNMKEIDLAKDDQLCKEMFQAVVTATSKLNDEQAFKLICNNERAAGQEIMHLHWHILSENELGQ